MDQKKMELLERSSIVFMKYGLKSVTMDDLCRELAISKKTIYKYFEDKEDLVTSIIEYKVDLDKNTCIHFTEKAVNAIEELVHVSKFVTAQLTNVNPSLLLDLRKHYPKAWKIMNDHKWNFVLEYVSNNIIRGQKENIYRENLDPKVLSRYYVFNMDQTMNGEVFPYPEFKTDEVASEILRFHIRGLANDNGISYLKEHFNREINE